METQPLKQVINQSGTHLAVSYEDKTIIYCPRTLSVLYTLPFEFETISFLYQTGLFVVVSSSKPSIASIHDYKYKRHVKDIDFVSPILKIHYSRNVLFVFSKQKIQGYDLSNDESIFYVKVSNGEMSFHSYFHQTLHLGYQVNNNFVSHSIWAHHKFELEEIGCSEGKYSQKGEYFVLKVKDNLNVYTNNSLINIIHLPSTKTIYFFNPINDKTPTLTLIEISQQGEMLPQIHSLFRLQDTNSKYVLDETKTQDSNLSFQGIVNQKLHILHNYKRKIYSIQE